MRPSKFPDSRSEKGQTSIDFAIGIILFIGIVGIALLFTGGDITGNQINEIDKTPQASSLATHLAYSELNDQQGKTSKTLDQNSVDQFFNEEEPPITDLPIDNELEFRIVISQIDETAAPPPLLEAGELTRSTGERSPETSTANESATLNGELVEIQVEVWK